MTGLLKRTTFKPTNSHQLSIVILPIVFVVLATICLALRFRARRLQKTAFIFDDWLYLTALLLTWGFQGVNLTAVFAGGAGLPIATVIAIDPMAVTRYLKIIFANFSLWVVTVSVVQLSILFFYIRLLGVVDWFRCACYALAAMIVGFGIAGFFSQVFSCTPVRKAWEPLEPGHCVEGKPYCSTISIIHVFFDLGIVVLPIPLTWKLQVAIRSKVMLSGLLGLGLFATIISLLKTVCVFDLTGIPQEDITDYLWLTILLQTLELPVGIICCCVPSLKPVWAEVAPKFGSMTGRLLSYVRSTRSTTSKSYRSRSGPNTGNESVAGFARLDDSSSQVGRGSMDNKTTAPTDEVELELANRTHDEGGNRIAVVNSYSVSGN